MHGVHVFDGCSQVFTTTGKRVTFATTHQLHPGSRDSFFELHRYLHIADNSTLVPPGSPEYKKLGKLQPIIDMVSERF